MVESPGCCLPWLLWEISGPPSPPSLCSVLTVMPYLCCVKGSRFEMPLPWSLFIARHRSQSCCRPSQKSGDIPRTRANLRAVSGVTERFPRTTSFSLGKETPSRIAKSDWLIPNGFRNSSSNISPGCVGDLFFGKRLDTGSFFLFMVPAFPYLLMVVRDFDFAGKASLPTKANSELIVNTNTMLACPITSESF